MFQRISIFLNSFWLPSSGSISASSSTLPPGKPSTMMASSAVSFAGKENGLQTPPRSALTSSPVAGNQLRLSPTPLSSAIGSPIILHHTPVRSRDIGEDMEQIRLSRQDNPYLKRVAGSQVTLVDEECIDSSGLSDSEDTTQLVSQSLGDDVCLSLSDVHEHLIRSPPPTVVPKTVNQFIFDNSAANRYRTLPPLRVNFNSALLMDQDELTDTQFRPASETQRKLSLPQDCNVTSVSAPNSPARGLFRSDPYTRKPAVKSGHCEVATHLSLGTGPVSEGRCYRTEIPLAPVQPPKRIPQRVPEQVFLNKPLLSHVSSVSSPARSIISSGGSHFKRSSSLRGTSSLAVNGSNLTLPIKCPHQPANTQVV